MRPDAEVVKRRMRGRADGEEQYSGDGRHKGYHETERDRVEQQIMREHMDDPRVLRMSDAEWSRFVDAELDRRGVVRIK